MNIVKFHFYEGKDWVSSIIKWRTCGKYSHVSIDINGIVYEALAWKGVSKSNDIYTYNDVGTCTKTIEVNFKYYDKFLEYKKFLEKQVGLKYDWIAIFNFLGNWNKNNPNRWFCSELGDTVFPHLIKDYKSDGELVAPEMLEEKLEAYNLGVNSK